VRKVLDYLGRHEARFVTDLCEYLRFPSVSAQSTHRQDMVRLCASGWCDIARESVCTRDGVPPRDIPSCSPGCAERAPDDRIIWYMVITTCSPRTRSNSGNRRRLSPGLPGDLLYARGSSDNKGEHFAHLKAVEAYLKTGEELPCDLTFVIEGEEEVGSRACRNFSKKIAKLGCRRRGDIGHGDAGTEVSGLDRSSSGFWVPTRCCSAWRYPRRTCSLRTRASASMLLRRG
jgi:hypothetical protein